MQKMQTTTSLPSLRGSVETHVEKTVQAPRPARSRWPPGDWFLGTSQGQWTFLVCVGSCFVLLGSLCWHATGGNADYDSSLQQSLWISWGLFFDPGTQTGIPATDPWYLHVVAVTFSMFGFVFNLAVLGLVVDTIRGKLTKFKELRSRVVANGHVLVLGWGDKTLFLLSELLAAGRCSQGRSFCGGRCGRAQNWRRIVVLAKRPVLDMQQEVEMHLSCIGFREHCVSYREGDPTDCSELAKVSAHSADDILVMGSSNSSDQQVTQTLLALAALPDFQSFTGDVFVEMQTAEGAKVATDLLPIAEAIVSRRAVNRILVLRALAPPVGYCYLDLVSFKGGQELYLRPVPKDLVGLSFDEACRCFPEAVVCGTKAAEAAREGSAGLDGGIIPSRGQKLEGNDVLLMLASSTEAADHCQLRLASGAGLAPPPERKCQVEDIFLADGRVRLGPWDNGPRTVLMIGCPSDFPEFLHIMDLHLAAGSHVHVLSERSEEWRDRAMYRHFGPSWRASSPYRNIEITHAMGPTTCKWALSELPLSTADCIIVLAERKTEDEPPQVADSRNLATVITVRGFLQELGRRKGVSKLKVVVELLDPRSQHVVECNHNVRRHGSFLYSSMLETAIFAMAAEAKTVYSSLMELLDPESGTGHITALAMADFVGPTEELSYMDLHGRVYDACGGVLLGWKRKSARYPELNPKDKLERRVRREDTTDVLLVLRPLPDKAPAPLRTPRSADCEAAPSFPGAVAADGALPLA